MCVVLVLDAVRFGLWTMMAERCYSVDDSIVLFSSNSSNSSSVIASYFFFFKAISAKQQRKPQAHTTAAGTVVLIDMRSFATELLCKQPTCAGRIHTHTDTHTQARIHTHLASLACVVSCWRLVACLCRSSASCSGVRCRRLAASLCRFARSPVSYTHLTLPTNREV